MLNIKQAPPNKQFTTAIAKEKLAELKEVPAEQSSTKYIVIAVVFVVLVGGFIAYKKFNKK